MKPNYAATRRNLRDFVESTSRTYLDDQLTEQERQKVINVFRNLLPDVSLETFLSKYYHPAKQFDNRELRALPSKLRDIRKRIDQKFKFGNFKDSDLPYLLAHILIELKIRELLEHEEESNDLDRLIANKSELLAKNLTTLADHLDGKRREYFLELAVRNSQRYFEISGSHLSDPDILKEGTMELSSYLTAIIARDSLFKTKYWHQGLDQDLIDDLISYSRTLIESVSEEVAKSQGKGLSMGKFFYILRDTKDYLDDVGEYPYARKVDKLIKVLNKKRGDRTKPPKQKVGQVIRNSKKSRKFLKFKGASEK